MRTLPAVAPKWNKNPPQALRGESARSSEVLGGLGLRPQPASRDVDVSHLHTSVCQGLGAPQGRRCQQGDPLSSPCPAQLP